MNYTKISRQLLESLNFRVFDKEDYYGFAGVSSPVPLIAENADEGILVIIDGAYCELYADTGDGGYEVIDMVSNINELPYKTPREIEIENRIKNLKTELAALENELCY